MSSFQLLEPLRVMLLANLKGLLEATRGKRLGLRWKSCSWCVYGVLWSWLKSVLVSRSSTQQSSHLRDHCDSGRCLRFLGEYGSPGFGVFLCFKHGVDRLWSNLHGREREALKAASVRAYFVIRYKNVLLIVSRHCPLTYMLGTVPYLVVHSRISSHQILQTNSSTVARHILRARQHHGVLAS